MKEILIRAATPDDTDEIHDLLAADGRRRNRKAIDADIAGYTLLMHDGRIAAAMRCSAEKAFGKAPVAVHPGYPESIIADSMRSLLTGVELRERSLSARLSAVRGGEPACRERCAAERNEGRATC